MKYMIFIHKIQTMYKLYKTYTNSSLQQRFYVFCTYRLYANYTKCIQMLIESYTLLLMYVFFASRKALLHSLLFKFSHQQRRHLLFFFKTLQNFRINLFIFKKVHRCIYVIDLLSINLIYLNF